MATGAVARGRLLLLWPGTPWPGRQQQAIAHLVVLSTVDAC
jgi:hypothetical protein